MKQLWLDLGNTRLKYWLTEDKKILEYGAEQHLQAPAELLLGLTEKFKLLAPEFIGVSSVLGTTINHKITHTLSKLSVPFELVSVDKDLPLMTSDYDEQQLGVDRWLQMLAVANEFDDICIVGCGTALTIDIIEKKQHLGGFIFPSIYLQREALQSGTRQISIPDTAFDSILPAINTMDAVHHGILLSIIGAVQLMINKYPKHQLILTGGDASIIQKHINTDAKIYDDLVLKGMQAYFG